MVFLLCLLAFILLLAVYVLFAPLLLEIDTRRKLYRFRVVPVFGIRWVAEEESYAELQLFGFRKRLAGVKAPAEKKIERAKKKKARRPFRFSFYQLRRLIRSFRVKKWRVNIDTGDMALNGWLFPLFYLLSVRIGHPCTINFRGENEIELDIRNNAFRMLRAFFSKKQT